MSSFGIHTDTALWLHNKLRNDESPWSSGNIASQFTNNIINEIYDCFMQLEPKTKIKILLSLLEIPLRNMENLKDSICRIVAIAEEDMDEWVRVAANIVRDYPEQFVLDQRLGKVTTHFQETVHEVVSEIERIQDPVNANLIPGECLYLNRTALSKIISNPSNPAKHFTLRRKPKSAELRAKITQKASEAANQRRSMHSSGIGSKSSLKRIHSLPSGGKLPPVQHSKSGMSKARPRKTQILEFADQPIGLREQKKRKKMQALEGTAEEITKLKGKKQQTATSTTASSDNIKQEDDDGEQDKDVKPDIKIENDQESEANTPQPQDVDETEEHEEEQSPPNKSGDDTEDIHNLSNDDDDDDDKPSTPTIPSYSPTISRASLASRLTTDLVSPTIPPPVAADGQLLYNLHTNNNNNKQMDVEQRRRNSSSSSTPNLLTSPPPPVAQQHSQYNVSQTQQNSQSVQQKSQKEQQQPQQKLSHEVNLNASLSTSTFQQELQMRVQHEKEMKLNHEHKQQNKIQQAQQQSQQLQQNTSLQQQQQQNLQHQIQQRPHQQSESRNHTQQNISQSQQQSMHDQHPFQDFQQQQQQQQLQSQQQPQQHHTQQQQLYNQHFLQQQQQLRQHHQHQHLQQRQFNTNNMQQQQQMGVHPQQQQQQGIPLSHQQTPLVGGGGAASNVPGIPPPNQPIPMNPNQQKKGLSLTREQMLAAQEMFRSANTVTRAEKALILGFMAGARENPFPQQGAVITIKLSEEMIPQGEQQVLVEMLFEMNYDTGHWRRLKRTRVIQPGVNNGEAT